MRKLAGKGAAREEALLAELLEKDFDPEEYDAHMAAAFGEDYYKQGLGANAEDEGDVLDPAYHKVRSPSVLISSHVIFLPKHNFSLQRIPINHSLFSLLFSPYRVDSKFFINQLFAVVIIIIPPPPSRYLFLPCPLFSN
jgi:hypothetical protein